MSHRTAPRLWCARTLEIEVKMMVAMEVAMAIFTARPGATPRWARMALMNGTMIMPPPMPSRPARNPVNTPRRASSTISRGSRLMGGNPEGRKECGPRKHPWGRSEGY